MIPTATKLGRDEIRSKIGDGVMGETNRVRDEKLNRDVAIKVLPRAFYVVASDGQRFLVNRVLEDNAMQPTTVVLNWTAQFKK